MFKKMFFIITVVFTTLFFTSSGMVWAKYLSLKEFGIKISAKNFYSKHGAKATGTITDPNKARYILSNAYKGNKVEVTNLGNGNVSIRNSSTGEEVVIDVTVTNPE